MTLLAHTIAPPAESERILLLDSWQKSSQWRRSKILQVLAEGEVLVAGSDGLALGWMATWEGRIAHAWTRGGYEPLSLDRELWEALGRPRELHGYAASKRVMVPAMRALMARVRQWE